MNCLSMYLDAGNNILSLNKRYFPLTDNVPEQKLNVTMEKL